MFLRKWFAVNQKSAQTNSGLHRLDPLLPGDPLRVAVMTNGTITRQHTDGSVTVRQLDGSDPTGNCRGKFCTVESVTIADLAYVTEHHINRILDTVSHVLRFIDGARCVIPSISASA